MEEEKKKKIKQLVFYAVIGIVFLVIMYFLFGDSFVEKNELNEDINVEVPLGQEEAIVNNTIGNYGSDYSANVSEDGKSNEEKELAKISEKMDITDSYLNEKSSENNSEDKRDDAISAVNDLVDYHASLVSNDEQKELELEYYKQQLESARDSLALQKKINEATEKSVNDMLEQANNMKNMRYPDGRLMYESQQDREEYERLSEERARTQAENKRRDEMGAEVETGMENDKDIVTSMTTCPDLNQRINEIQQKKRNGGFLTVKKASIADGVEKNTLKVYVPRTTVLKQGDYLQLYTLEPAMLAGRIKLPARSLIMAKAVVNGTRMDLQVSSIIYKGELIKVSMQGFDLDGQKGIYIPGSDEIGATKEIGSESVSSAGQGVILNNNNSSALDQVIANTATGAIQGVSKYIQKKINKIRVTVKAGYELYLYQEK